MLKLIKVLKELRKVILRNSCTEFVWEKNNLCAADAVSSE